MKSYVKKNIKKLVLFMLGLFILMFMFRLVYGYHTVTDVIPTAVFMDMESGIDINSRKNYASMKYKVGASPSPVRVDQKYEKIADIRTYSTEFDIEETYIRRAVENYDGLIQFENKSGNEGYRKLDVIIGCHHITSILYTKTLSKSARSSQSRLQKPIQRTNTTS